MKLAWTITLLLVAGSASAANPVTFGGELGATYDGNPGNAHSSGDVRPTERISAGANATWTQRFGEFTALQLRGALDGEGDVQLPDLSFGRLGARVRLLNKPGEGFYVPVLALWTSGDYKVSGSTIRSGDEWRVGAYVSEPVTTQISTRLGFSWTRSDSRSRVFDGQSRACEFSVDWTVLPQLSVYGEFQLGSGPIVVSAEGDNTIVPKSEHLYLDQVADSVESDPAFGDDWFAFRLNARTRVATVGVNLPLTRDISLDLQLRQIHSVADTSGAAYAGGGGGGGGGGGAAYSGFDYDRWIGGISLLLRF